MPMTSVSISLVKGSHIAWALVGWGNRRPWRESKDLGAVIPSSQRVKAEGGMSMRETWKQAVFFRSSPTDGQANEEFILVMVLTLQNIGVFIRIYFGGFLLIRWWFGEHILLWVTIPILSATFQYVGMKFFLSSVGETFLGACEFPFVINFESCCHHDSSGSLQMQTSDKAGKCKSGDALWNVPLVSVIYGWGSKIYFLYEKASWRQRAL